MADEKMRIFISWSGARSEALALALKDWLPLVLHYVDPWLSRSDINAGGRWGVEIARSLEACNFGIICITRENQDAPWLLFEAGALAKSVQDGRVVPLLLDLDMKEISGPLAQFQAKKVERSEIKELILSLNKSTPDPIHDGKLEKLFSMAWPDIEGKIVAIPKIKGPAKPSRPEGEILEELVAGFRNLEVRLLTMKEMEAKELEMRMIMAREVEDTRKLRARGPRLAELKELMSDIEASPEDPLRSLFLASVLRSDAPEFYDITFEFYKSVKSGNLTEAAVLRKSLMHMLKRLQYTFFLKDLNLGRIYAEAFDDALSAIDGTETHRQGATSSRSDSALEIAEGGPNAKNAKSGAAKEKGIAGIDSQA